MLQRSIDTKQGPVRSHKTRNGTERVMESIGAWTSIKIYFQVKNGKFIFCTLVVMHQTQQLYYAYSLHYFIDFSINYFIFYA